MNAYQWIKCLSVKEIAHACIEMFNHYHNRWDCVGNYAEYGASTILESLFICL